MCGRRRSRHDGDVCLVCVHKRRGLIHNTMILLSTREDHSPIKKRESLKQAVEQSRNPLISPLSEIIPTEESE